MPYVTGRVSLAGPIAQDIADSLRYPARSGGTAGLVLATLLGFGLMGPLFLTGNPTALILYALLPPEPRAEITFGSWFLVALPHHLIIFTGLLAFILWRYRPTEETISEHTLQLQRAVLGRTSGSEWLALAVLGVNTRPTSNRPSRTL